MFLVQRKVLKFKLNTFTRSENAPRKSREGNRIEIEFSQSEKNHSQFLAIFPRNKEET